MANLLDAVTRIHEKLFRPTEEQMPFADVWAAARSAWTGMLVDLRLSDNEYATREVFFVPGDNLQFPIPATDFAFPVRMEAVTSPTELETGKLIPLVAIQNLPEERRIGRLSYAITGRQAGQPLVEFTFPIYEHVRFVYEPDIVLYPPDDDALEILDMHLEYLVCKAAISLLPRLRMPYVDLGLLQQTLALDRDEWQKRWDVYLHHRSPPGAKTMRPAWTAFKGRRFRGA